MTLLFLTGVATVLFILVSIPSKIAFINGQSNRNLVKISANSSFSDITQNDASRENNKVASVPQNKQIQSVDFGSECINDICRQTFQEIAINLNQSVDPCEDFYAFACGNFPTHNPIPADKSEVSQFTKIADMVNLEIQQLLVSPMSSEAKAEPNVFRSLKNFYSICLGLHQDQNETKRGRNEIHKVLMALGATTWPVTIADEDGNTTWETVYYNTYNLGLKPDYFFKYYVDSNYTDSSIKLLSMDSPSFILNREALIKGPTSENVQHYFNTILALNSYLNGNSSDSNVEILKKMVEFEIGLAKAKKPLVDVINDLQALFNVFTLDELARNQTQFPWTRFVHSLTTSNINIDGHLQIILTEPAYTARLIQLLQDTPAHVVKSYLIWRAVYDVSEYLNDEVRNIRETLIAKVEGSKKRKKHALECVDMVKTNFAVALSAIYVRRFSNENSKREAIKMTKMMKSSFKSILNESTWSDEDKQAAFEKIDGMLEDIAYRVELLNDTNINEYYKRLSAIESTDTLLKSSLKVIAFKRDMPFLNFDQPVEKHVWHERSYATEVNAFYDPISNSIIIPAAILSGIVFNASRPNFANYGAIGFTVAHEITHGFDNIGRQIDKDGNLKNWLSMAQQKDFDERLKCIAQQYDKYTTVDNVKINGALTAKENVADFGGLKTAYRAYNNYLSSLDTNKLGEEIVQAPLNNKQLFWMYSAQIWCHNAKDENLKYTAMTNSHPTNHIRVNGVLRNTMEFSHDYNCPLGSYMNPADKCMPW